MSHNNVTRPPLGQTPDPYRHTPPHPRHPEHRPPLGGGSSEIAENLGTAHHSPKGHCKSKKSFRLLPSGKIRLVEVKSSKQVREVYKIQAALYHSSSTADEIAVSNREMDELLTPDYIQRKLKQAELTQQLLARDPSGAAKTYTPHPDACYTCGNTTCPCLRDRATPRRKNDELA